MNAYRLLFFLTLLNLLNFVDRQLIASFANFIVPDLGLTDTQYGFLTTVPFIVFYSIAGLFMGVLADMVNRPKLIAFGVVLWSVFTALTGAAKGFISMALPRMFIGIGESILTPTSMSLLSDSFPAKRMGFAAGFYYMGVPIGVGVSLLIAGYLGESLGWRNCFYLLGGLGLILGLCALLFKDRSRKSSNSRGEVQTLSKESTINIVNTLIKALKTSSALRFTILAGVFYHIVLGASGFEQLWLVQERGFERSEIAQLVGWIGVFAGLSGNLIGGILSDWWQENTNQGRPMFLFWLALITLPIGIFYRFVEPGTTIFWIGIVIGYFQLGCFFVFRCLTFQGWLVVGKMETIFLMFDRKDTKSGWNLSNGRIFRRSRHANSASLVPYDYRPRGTLHASSIEFDFLQHSETRTKERTSRK